MPSAVRSLMLAAIASLFAGAVLFAEPGAPDAHAPAKPKPRPILHLRLQGDLDCAKLADDFARHIDEARAGSASPLLLLELDGRKWRSDVVLAIARVIRSDRAPIASIVYLNSPGAGVGTGQAALALVADACYLAPRTRIVYDPADDLRAFMPDGADPDAIDREIRGLAWTALQDRRADALLTTLIPRPSSTLFAARAATTDADPDSAGSPAKLKLFPTPPATGDYLTLIPTVPDKGPPRAEIACDTACRIGLASGAAGSLTEALTRQSIRPGRRTEATLRSGLPDARASLERSIRDIDEARRQAAAAVDEVYRLRTAEHVPRQRRVGDEQSPMLHAARQRLESAELATTDYPELLRLPPPGATTVGQTPLTLQRAWRDLFQSRREDLDKLAAKARTLSEKQYARP